MNDPLVISAISLALLFTRELISRAYAPDNIWYKLLINFGSVVAVCSYTGLLLRESGNYFYLGLPLLLLALTKGVFYVIDFFTTKNPAEAHLIIHKGQYAVARDSDIEYIFKQYPYFNYKHPYLSDEHLKRYTLEHVHHSFQSFTYSHNNSNKRFKVDRLYGSWLPIIGFKDSDIKLFISATLIQVLSKAEDMKTAVIDVLVEEIFQVYDSYNRIDNPNFLRFCEWEGVGLGEAFAYKIQIDDSKEYRLLFVAADNSVVAIGFKAHQEIDSFLSKFDLEQYVNNIASKMNFKASNPFRLNISIETLLHDFPLPKQLDSHLISKADFYSYLRDHAIEPIKWSLFVSTQPGEVWLSEQYEALEKMFIEKKDEIMDTYRENLRGRI